MKYIIMWKKWQPWIKQKKYIFKTTNKNENINFLILRKRKQWFYFIKFI